MKTKDYFFINFLKIPFWVVLIMTLIFESGSFAQLPVGFVINKLTTNNIVECIKMEHAPDGRIFIAERGGNLKVLQNNVVTTIHTVQVSTQGEQGLIGMTLHSNFAQNGKCYIYYTNPTMTRHYLDVLVVSATNQIVSSTRLMEFDPIVNQYHNGGAMLFKNEHLYLCIGENTVLSNATSLTTYFGKVLRLLDDGQPAPGNPYYNTAGASRQQRSIWAVGMRNPWTMTLDPITGKIFVGNVGGDYEEINDVTSPDATKNYDYGWDTEGKSGIQQRTNTIFPLFTYQRNTYTPNTCAHSAGCLFNPPVTNYPAQYRKRYYFADWCTTWMRSLDSDNMSTPFQGFLTGVSQIISISTGIDGNLYYAEYGPNGNINRIEYTLSTVPTIVNHPVSQTLFAQQPVTFGVTASGTAPFTYQWQKNNVNIPNATSRTYSIPSLVVGDAGNYRVIVTNNLGRDTSNAAALVVQPFNNPPVATINTPLSTTKFSVLDVISYSGSATDVEDGVIPAANFNWEVRFYHKECPTCEHWHPSSDAVNGARSGTFIADNGGESSSNVWLRLILTVRDANGRIGKDSVDIQPNKVDITVTSNKPGLKVTFGTEGTTPFTTTMVVNHLAGLVALPTQTIGDTIYTFTNWSQGGTANQSLRIPNVNTTYQANYTATWNGLTTFTIPRTATAPVIDGTIETLWTQNMYSQSFSKPILGTITNAADLSGTFKAYWDNNYLYLLGDITDNQFFNDSPDHYNDDNVEVYIDINNDKLTTYAANDRAYNFSMNDGTTIGTTPVGRSTTGINYAMVPKTGGYIFEARIPWTTLIGTPSVGQLMGFDFHVNDDDDGGARDGKLSWNAATDNAWQNPTFFGIAKLSGDILPTEVEESEIQFNAINYYPNPFNESLTIQSNGNFTIYDLTGEIVEKGICDGNCKVGNQLAVGVYFFEIENNGRIQRAKVLKK